MRARSAAALPAALLVLALASALTVGGAYVARSMVAAGIQAKRDLELGFPGEDAMTQVVTAWDSVARASQPVGHTLQLHTEAPSIGRPALWITRLSAESFWIVAAYSTPSTPPLQRRTGLVIITRNGLPTAATDFLWTALP